MTTWIVRFVVFFVETLGRLLVAVLERLAASPVVHRLAELTLQATASMVVQLLNIPAVQQAVAASVAEGMNCFLRQPNLEEHLLQMADTMSRTQPELARQQGRDFPVLVGNFLQGMLSPNKSNTNNSNNNKQRVDEPTPSNSNNNKQKQPNQQPQQREEENVSPASSPLPTILSFPNLQKTWSNEDSASKRTYDTRSESALSDGCDHHHRDDSFLSASDVLQLDISDSGSFHYRYGPLGLGVPSSFAAVEQKKER